LNKIRAFFAAKRGSRSASIAVYGALLLVAVLLYGMGEGWFKAAPRASPPVETSTLEGRLESILSAIRGAGRVRVLITYGVDAGSEQGRELQGQTGITLSSQPLASPEMAPEIRGALVVAEGASDPAVRLKLQRAVQAATGLPLSCIEVFEMEYPS